METIKIALDIDIKAPREKVFDALTTNIGMWWGHSFSESPAAIKLEPRAGGRFYEDFDGSGDGALYATVEYVKRPEELRMSGPMGMRVAVVGHIAFVLEATDEGTRIHLTHDAFGNVTPEHQAGYTQGWQDLLGDKMAAYLAAGG